MKKYVIGFKSGNRVTVMPSNDNFVKEIIDGMEINLNASVQIHTNHTRDMFLVISEVEFILPEENILPNKEI